MPDSPALATLEDVRGLLAAHDPEGLLAPCGLGDLVVGPDALRELPTTVLRLAGDGLGRRPRVTLLVDETAILRHGRDVKSRVESDLADGCEVTRVTLSDGSPELHVVEEMVELARAGCAGADVVVALGGGTISDLGKLAADGADVRLVTVMTAASVDGYTDDVSVTLTQGVKRTIPSRWPDVVLGDAETVAGAPPRMTRSGYGEMTSMYVAPADWRLAALVGAGPAFHPGPVALLGALADQLDSCAPGVAASEPAAVQTLTWALALRGIATGVAGTTACLSGVEHLVSHMLDVRAAQLGSATGLHGEQVGVGSVLAACAWEMVHERLATTPTARVRAVELDPQRAESRVRAAFEGLDPTGRIGTECWSDYARKLGRLRAARPQADAVLAEWQAHRPSLDALLRPSDVIARGLRSAGAPVLYADLGSAVDAATGRWALQHCAFMRDRFTVVDLLNVLGWWEDSDVDEVLARAEVAAAAGVTA